METTFREELIPFQLMSSKGIGPVIWDEFVAFFRIIDDVLA